MLIYVRRIFNHDLTHQISITNEVFYSFFDNVTLIRIKGKRSEYVADVSLLLETDPRLGGEIKKLLRLEGEAYQNNYLMFYKKTKIFEMEIIKPGNQKYEILKNVSFANERHLISDFEKIF